MDNVTILWPEELPASKVKLCGAYVIEHVKTGKLYVGSSGDLVRRKREQIYTLTNNSNHSEKLQELYKLDPEIKWKFYITATRAQAYKAEQDVIDILLSMDNDLLLNIAEDAKGYPLGHVIPEEQRRVISERNTGNQYAKGRVNSPERRAELSALHKGKAISEEHRAAVSAKFKGVAQSAELIEARRAAMRASDKVKRKHPTINGVTYQSVVDAANALGISKSTIKFRIKSKTEEWKDWYYLA